MPSSGHPDGTDNNVIVPVLTEMEKPVIAELCCNRSICLMLWGHKGGNYILPVKVRESLREEVSFWLGLERCRSYTQPRSVKGIPHRGNGMYQ
jgi:hypothetical protein